MAKKDENILVGLDVGTTKVCALIGEVIDQKRVQVIGIGTHPSKGLKKGMVVNIEATVDSIRRAVEEAETMAGVEVAEVFTGIAGEHIRGVTSRAAVQIKDGEVKNGDIRRVLEAAKIRKIPSEWEILHALPQEFFLDDRGGVTDPMGMSGVRLEAEVLIITAASSSVENIVKCVNRAGLEVLELVLQPVASSEAVLTSDEKDLGVAMVDLGGGTTDIALFVEGSLRHAAILPIGGTHFTHDIAVGLRTPAAAAEKIKIRYGCASASLVDDRETIEVPDVGLRPPRVLPRQLLAEIIEPRAEEIFKLVREEIRKAHFEELVASGIVLTGGSASLPGLADVAARTLALPARVGVPAGVGGLADAVAQPIYATSVGLLLHALKGFGRDDQHAKRGGPLGRMKRMTQRWVEELF